MSGRQPEVTRVLRSGPPPVTHASGRTPALAVLLLALWCAGMLACLALVWQLLAVGPGSWAGAVMGLLVPALAALALARFWRSQRPRRLRWDGRRWLLLDGQAEVPLQVALRLDLQHAMLLRSAASVPGAAPSWLWLQRGRQSADWHLLRCALYFCALDDADAAPA